MRCWLLSVEVSRVAEVHRFTEEQRAVVLARIDELARVLDPDAFDPNLNWAPGVRSAHQNLATVYAMRAVLAGWVRGGEQP